MERLRSPTAELSRDLRALQLCQESPHGSHLERCEKERELVRPVFARPACWTGP